MARTSQRRSLDGMGMIVSDPGICGGSETIAGTRIRVSDIVRYWRLYRDEARIIEALPHLRQEQVHAALSYYDAHRDEIEEEIKGEVPALTNP